ncbi:methyl binding domain113 [Zea mays]|uniref:Methyl binding domain113 n=3 Tax=Zea mays TaxID=4577 RepID=A0A1D6J531_MAIZE|nr:methyl binding domain113 [Zea mays]
MVETRRSARRSGSGSLPADGAPSEPASSSPATSLPPRENNGLVISNDNTLKQTVEVEKQGRQGKEVLVVHELDESNEDSGSLDEPPGWLPDGWTMEVCQEDNGSIYKYYTSPMSGYMFTSKMETLHYLFSGVEERMLELQASAEDNELHESHTWLPRGWVIEVRAGGKKMDKMYKVDRCRGYMSWRVSLCLLQFYVHLPTGQRFLSKAEVLHFVNKGMVSTCDMDVLCDTSTDDNILAHVEFNPDGLPDGWVKETISRKFNDGIRKDQYYTDPVSHRVFRTLKSVLSYLGTGEISRHSYLPRRNVIDMYSFDKCADLPKSMVKRLKAKGQAKKKFMRAQVLDKDLSNGQTSNHCEGAIGLTQSDPEGDKFGSMEAACEKGTSSETMKQRIGRPKKILKQTNDSISDRDKGSHQEHIEAKEEVDICGGKDLTHLKTLERTEAQNSTMITKEVNNNDTAEKNLSKIEGDNSDLVTGTGLHKQENSRLTEVSEKATFSTGYKFYKRRSCNKT